MRRRGSYRTIGQVVAMLAEEFPGLSASSLRFLEREGLIKPFRTRGRHRLYSEGDIARIRLIKGLQARRYYPLEVIKKVLANAESPAEVEAHLEFKQAIYRPLAYDPAFVPIARREVARRTGLSQPTIAKLEAFGFLHHQASANGQALYDEDDLRIAECVARELKRGAKVEDFGPYAAAVRALVLEEFRIIDRLLQGREPTPQEAQTLKEDRDAMLALVRAKLIRHVLLRRQRGEHIE